MSETKQVASLQTLATKTISHHFTIWELAKLAKHGVLPAGIIVEVIDQFEHASLEFLKAHKPKVEKPVVPMPFDYYPEGIY